MQMRLLWLKRLKEDEKFEGRNSICDMKTNSVHTQTKLYQK